MNIKIFLINDNYDMNNAYENDNKQQNDIFEIKDEYKNIFNNDNYDMNNTYENDNINKQQIPTKYIGGGYFSDHEHEMTPEPPTIHIESVDEDSSTDYFSICGNNLKCDGNSVRCVRQSNSFHSAFGIQLITIGRKIDWIVRIDKGHSIKIGICGKRMIAMD
eukprot:108733_1